MHITKKAEAVLYFVDGVRGKPLKNIELSAKKEQYIQKENGCVVFLHIEREQKIKIQKKGYAPMLYVIKPSEKIQTILLQPIDNENIISLCIQQKQWKNKKIYYTLNEKKCGKKILGRLEKNSLFLPMEYEQSYPLQNRNVIIQGCEDCYTITAYDFQKKGYLLKQPLEKEMEKGKLLFVLNETKSDEKGNMTLVFEKKFFENEKNILFFPEKKEE